MVQTAKESKKNALESPNLSTQDDSSDSDSDIEMDIDEEDTEQTDGQAPQPSTSKAIPSKAKPPKAKKGKGRKPAMSAADRAAAEILTTLPGNSVSGANGVSESKKGASGEAGGDPHSAAVQMVPLRAKGVRVLAGDQCVTLGIRVLQVIGVSCTFIYGC